MFFRLLFVKLVVSKIYPIFTQKLTQKTHPIFEIFRIIISEIEIKNWNSAKYEWLKFI